MQTGSASAKQCEKLEFLIDASILTGAHRILLSKSRFKDENFSRPEKARTSDASLKYCSDVCGDASPSSHSILHAIQNRAISLIGDLALSSSLKSLSFRQVSDLGLFFRYFLARCSAGIPSLVPPSVFSRATRRTAEQHPYLVQLSVSAFSLAHLVFGAPFTFMFPLQRTIQNSSNPALSFLKEPQIFSSRYHTHDSLTRVDSISLLGRA